MMGSPMIPYSNHPKYSYNNNNIPIFRVGPNHLNLAAAVALRLRDAFQHRLQLSLSLRSSLLQSISRLGDHVPHLKDLCHERAIQFTAFNRLQWSFNALSGTLMNLSFFSGGGDSRRDSKDVGNSGSRFPTRNLFENREWTNTLLAANVLVYIAQTVSDGKVLYWGAKVNSLIRQGQLWRLATSAFLHTNLLHLMVNCYSLNSVGPSVEKICGPERFLAIYFTSAITSSAMSYWFNKAPAVGASGAIFGLVGSVAIYLLRHRDIIKDTEDNLIYIAKVVALNMTFGLVSKGIDNWGHFGGLIGGAAVSWLIGPAWEVESISRDGIRTLRDKAPIYSLIKRDPK